MDSPVLGIITNTPSVGSIGANPALALLPTRQSTGLSAGLGSLSSALLASDSTTVELSGLAQLLSASASFEDQMSALKPGTASGTGGQNFASDLASLAAETQYLVDAFNNLQENIASVGTASDLLGGSLPGASRLAQTLATQAQASYANGSSTLTDLAQLGISFEATTERPGRLSVDLDTLKAAFDADPAGTFALLSQAAKAFGDTAANFTSETGSQLSTLNALAQSSATNQLITSSLLSSTQTTGGLNLADLLALESLTGSAMSAQQIVLAMNQYALVSTLLG